MNVLSRHAGDVCPTDYELAEDFVHHYAAAYMRSGHEDPRDRVWLGSWSTHRTHRPDCDCRARMIARADGEPRARDKRGHYSERCLRQVKRRRRWYFDVGIWVIRVRSEKGGMLKATKSRKARGNAHAIWVGAEVEREITRLQRLNRGAPTPPAPPARELEDDVEQLPAAAAAAGVPARRGFAPLSQYLTPDGRRRLMPRPAPALRSVDGHPAGCSCEHCVALVLPLLTGPDPPAKPQT